MRFAAIIALLLLVGCISGCQRAEVASPQPGDGATATADAQRVDADLGEWFIRLNPSEVDAGQVRFVIRNVGDATHALELEGQGVEHRSPNLAAGASAEMIVDMRPGTYTAYCPIGNHDDRGMRTTFTVR